MSAHTPSPWRAVFDIGNPEGSQWGVQTDKGLWICDCFDNAGPRKGAGRPNAKLMAAAPDLLAALQGVLLVADRATVEFDAAHAAIAKATQP